ncbi:hypothetical protein FA95DRAFT_1560652 [Auriscalpium vulgare]|uniref:Uncharacterized protein n=1 Tax=Auriscalpium vulgare TaxID=40419 RepID=A0ACB8RNY4_9AGAM|nr:hypothetical protein FA95DRAFT_1560652 [Auriscalpium vulgare]
MTDRNDPALLAKDYLIFVKLIHALGGLYIWEFVSNLDFEWDIYKGRRSYRWSFWLYIGCRLMALAAVITMLVGFDATSKLNCTGQVVCAYLFGYIAFFCASGLVVLRVGALWEWNRPVMVIACLAWTANTAFAIRSAAISRGVWSDSAKTCIALHTEASKDNIITTLVTDTVLLVLMWLGLMRWHRAGLEGGIWRLLFNQGLFWILVVTLAEVPSTVFILLNLNAPWNLMFQVPELIIMTIGVSRIYRGLLDYNSIADLQSAMRVPASTAMTANSALVFFAQKDTSPLQDRAKRAPVDEEMGLPEPKMEGTSSISSSSSP